jgi:hypothetical protein
MITEMVSYVSLVSFSDNDAKNTDNFQHVIMTGRSVILLAIQHDLEMDRPIISEK